MSAVLPETLRLRLKAGNSLQAPSTVAEEQASATTAPTRPSAVASLTALAWRLTAGVLCVGEVHEAMEK